jgi:anaerobic magnesium-protoporphyrin IX monomethyl ester cyclase
MVLTSEFKRGPVLLVSTPIAYTFPNSYAYLAAYLKDKGEDIRMIFRDVGPTELVKKIMSVNPVLVGFGSLYPELKEIGQIISLLNKAGRKFPIVVGGQMVSPTPEFSVSVTGADYGVVGEGEIILYNLVTALRQNQNTTTIKGLVVNNNGNIVFNGPGPFIKDLSTLPPVPYELFPEKEWLNIGDWYAKHYPHQILWRAGDKVINVHGGRGCPFTCNFCYHHSKPRYRPISNMMSEANMGLKKFNGTMLYFSDDLVLSSPKRAEKLIEGIKNLDGRKIEFSISSRFDILSRMDDSLISEMKSVGCRIMGLGAESGSDRILKIIGKNCTADDILTGIEKLTKHNILPTVTFQLGQHTETEEDADASIELMRKCVNINPNMQFNFTITTPFPGSPLYSLLLKDGKIKNHRDFYDRYFSNSGIGVWNQIVNVSLMSDSMVKEKFNKIWDVYKNEKSKILKRPISQIC